MIDIIPEDFEIQPHYFLHHSALHGKHHTYRVMCHVLLLGKKIALVSETRIAFFAAFIHDMARKHDGLCILHGPRAAKQKVPIFKPLFQKYSLTSKDIDAMKTAISNHSQYFEIRKKHPHYLPTAMLKDADALDRIRMGENNLNMRFLRLKETSQLIDFSHKLFYKTNNIADPTFRQFLEFAESLSGEKLFNCSIRS